MIDKRSGMGAVGDVDRFMKYQTAQAIGDMPNAEGGGGAAGMGMGLGAGVGMGAAMMNAMGGATQQQQPQQQAPAGGADDIEARLTKLASLKEKGLITDEEFAQRKAQILSEI
jgi:membrane protease subunit (stomatin/prohibitin family)